MSEENSETITATQVVEAPEVTENIDNSPSQEVVASEAEKTVPLSVVQKERKKRQQIQQELEELRSSTQRQQSNQPAEEDYSKYESVTREDLSKSQFLTVRAVREGDWQEQNPERAIEVEHQLDDFLKQRPNLRSAIEDAPNRYKEAYELMRAFGGVAEKKAAPQVRKDAPNAPGSVPKAAGVNATMDVMNMSDQEFRDWAKSKRRR